MIFIEHRVNTLEQLQKVSPANGVEIDLRSDAHSASIYLHHDPFTGGVPFADWLRLFKDRNISGPIILNTKEDGLEESIMEACEAWEVRNFFFLDTTLPTLVKWSLKHSEKRFACRLSKYEPASALSCFRGKVEWLWVDCFDGIPLDAGSIDVLRSDFRICLVSPDLHGIQDVHPSFSQLLRLADAVCTKKPDFWKNQLNLG